MTEKKQKPNPLKVQRGYYLSRVNVDFIKEMAKQNNMTTSAMLDKLMTEARQEWQGIQSVFEKTTPFEILDFISDMVKKKDAKAKGKKK